MASATIRVPGWKVTVPLSAEAPPRDIVPMDGPAGELMRGGRRQSSPPALAAEAANSGEPRAPHDPGGRAMSSRSSRFVSKTNKSSRRSARAADSETPRADHASNNREGYGHGKPGQPRSTASVPRPRSAPGSSSRGGGDRRSLDRQAPAWISLTMIRRLRERTAEPMISVKVPVL